MNHTSNAIDVPCKLIVIPTDLGAEATGSRQSAIAITSRVAKSLSRVWKEHVCAISVPVPSRKELVATKHLGIWYRKENAAVIRSTFETCCEGLSDTRQNFILGGDHTSSIGSVLAVQRWALHRHLKLGLIWIDAHPDMNTPSTSPSGRLHGMALAAIQGIVDVGCDNIIRDFVEPHQVFVVGLQSIDEHEIENIEVAKRRGQNFVRLEDWNSSHFQFQKWASDFDVFYISIDLDSLHPSIAPGVNARCVDGFSWSDIYKIRSFLDGQVIVLDAVEYNARRDHDHLTERSLLRIANTFPDNCC